MISRKKRREREKRKTVKIIRTIVLVFIIYIIFNLSYSLYNENKIKTSLENQEKSYEIQKVIKIETAPIPEKEVIDNTYMDYEVSAKLEIPKIHLETFILKNYSKNAMDISPTKFAGPYPNEPGNYCIVGHNYKKENMFSELINLNIGDELFLIDNKNGKVRYTIYDIYKVRPSNLKPIEQNTDGRREITLISCVNYADLRIIVKAAESLYE